MTLTPNVLVALRMALGLNLRTFLVAADGKNIAARSMAIRRMEEHRW
jgi:hypothetical protein